jgi:hypothetical protein
MCVVILVTGIVVITRFAKSAVASDVRKAKVFLCSFLRLLYLKY